MKTSKIIIGILSILIGIVALIESYDVFRLASSFGVNGFHIYVGFIVGFIFICIGISSLMMMDKQSKQYAETTLSLSSVAIFLCFRGPELFTDLLFFAIWGAICFIFAFFAYYSAKKHDENEEYNQLVNLSTCPYCNAVVDESTMFCSSCGKKVKRNCPHCGALIMVNRTFCSNCKRKIDDEVSSVTFESSQKKCPQCGTSINEGVAFCSECGCKIPQGNVCSHCGAPVSNDDVFCKNCGNKVCDDCESSTNTQAIQIRKCNHCGAELNNDDAFCPNCGAKIVGATAAFSYAEPQQRINANDNSSDDNNSRGYLYIRWDGKWALIDYKVQILVNGIKQGEYSFKDGFEVVVPISSPEMLVETKMSFHKTKKVLSLNPQENYSYNLVYNTVSGSFGFVLCDNDGNELETDKLHWGYFLLCFLIPIVGFIYALSIRKKKPATSNQALMVSLLGFVVSLILSYSMPVAISRYNEIKEAKLAREKFVKDSLEQVRQDSLNFVAQKEKEELEAKRYEDFKKKFTFKNFLVLLENYDKVSFAQKCGLELIYKEIDNDGEITCEEYVYGFDIEKGDKKESGYEIVAKSNHACYLIYNLDSSTYGSMNFKDSSDAEYFQEQAKEYGLLVLDGSMYVPKTKMESGYHYVDSLDWGGEYDPIYGISQTDRQNGWYRVHIGIDF